MTKHLLFALFLLLLIHIAIVPVERMSKKEC